MSLVVGINNHTFDVTNITLGTTKLNKVYAMNTQVYPNAPREDEWSVNVSEVNFHSAFRYHFYNEITGLKLINSSSLPLTVDFSISNIYGFEVVNPYDYNLNLSNIKIPPNSEYPFKIRWYSEKFLRNVACSLSLSTENSGLKHITIRGTCNCQKFTFTEDKTITLYDDGFTTGYVYCNSNYKNYIGDDGQFMESWTTYGKIYHNGSQVCGKGVVAYKETTLYDVYPGDTFRGIPEGESIPYIIRYVQF